MGRTSSGKELLKALAAVLVIFGLIESLLRITYFLRNASVPYVALPYVLGDEYVPVPPWVDGLRILEPDDVLIWRNRPSVRRRYIDVFSPVQTEEERRFYLRQFLPVLPDSLQGNPRWEVTLNSEGFRDTEFRGKKAPHAFRIICLGDSWTFGANVGPDQAYPGRLGALLRQEFPDADFEVLNLGVLGYSSFQGVELYSRRGLDLDPDLVVIAFAMNDAKVAGWRDKDIPKETTTVLARIGRLLERIEAYKLLRYVALLFKYKPNSVGHYLQGMADAVTRADEINAEKWEQWTRVSLPDYEKNIKAMIDLAKGRAAGAILLYNAIEGESPYRTVLERISRDEGLPLVDSSALIAAARRKIEADLEEKLGLRPSRVGSAPSLGRTEVIFRVYMGDRPVRKAVYIVGTHPELGGLVPNRVAMYDDGTHGDQKAGDKVWAFAATFSPGTRLFYVYTNSGKQGKWEGLDVPEIRRFTVEMKDKERTVYRPIESFGKIYMQADSWHPDAAGYDLIARALLEVLKRDPKVQAHVMGRPR